MTDDERMDQEFGFVPLNISCRDPLIAAEGDLRECRRIRGHASDCVLGSDPRHCSGWDTDRIWWL